MIGEAAELAARTEAAFPVQPHRLPCEEIAAGRYRVRFARRPADLDAVLKMRFEVFNLELGEGLRSSWATGRDADAFDPVCHHLMVEDAACGEVVGTYRLQTAEMAAAHHGFYSDAEFDLSGLPSGVLERSVELGRACVSRRHRGSRVLFLLWRGLALYAARNRTRYLFGCCSVPGQDPHLARAVSDRLAAEGRVHPELRVAPRPAAVCYPEGFEARAGTRAELPPLFRDYLLHGARVCGPPALDREFRTIDFFVIFDAETVAPETVRTFLG